MPQLAPFIAEALRNRILEPADIREAKAKGFSYPTAGKAVHSSFPEG